MIPAAGLSANTIVLRAIFLSTVALLGACDDADEPVKQQIQAEDSEPPLPVQEWYPRPKHRPQSQAYSHSPAIQPRQMMPSQSSGQEAVSQQPWTVTVPQPAYKQQQPVYTHQQPVIVYQLPQPAAPPQYSGWTYQQPVTQPSQSWSQTQQVVPGYQVQPVVPGYQYVPRPWGDVTGAIENNHNNHTDVYSETWPPTTTGGGYKWGNTGQQGAVPPGVYYGNVW